MDVLISARSSKRYTKALQKKCVFILSPAYALKGDNTSEEITAQLGAKRYAEYIDRYVQKRDMLYICFDYYVYSASLSGMLENMEIVSKQ